VLLEGREDRRDVSRGVLSKKTGAVRGFEAAGWYKKVKTVFRRRSRNPSGLRNIEETPCEQNKEMQDEQSTRKKERTKAWGKRISPEGGRKNKILRLYTRQAGCACGMKKTGDEFPVKMPKEGSPGDRSLKRLD